jgi:hypothetical protein
VVLVDCHVLPAASVALSVSVVLSVPGGGGTTGGGAAAGGGTTDVVVVLSEYELCANAAVNAALPVSKKAAILSIKPCFMS